MLDPEVELQTPGGPRLHGHDQAGDWFERNSIGEDSADAFSFEVCTPNGLASRRDRDARRGTLVVGAFSWEAVEAALNQFVRSVSGDDWAEVAEKLNRFMHWEFEDYQPYEGE